ncbi:MAG: IS66 family insertion sequence element accessory protein TnpB [Chthoniobacteraceae bacterium]
MNEKLTQVMKVDVRGRVWTPRERREAVLDELERSGVPAVKFAEHIGVKYPTLASWVQKRRRERGAAQATGAAAELRWVEAVSTAAGGGLCVHLPGGARMEVADRVQAALAAELVRALAADTGPARC